MFLFETAPDGSLVLSGVQDARVALTVPDRRDGKAVRRVARGAFRELPGVRTLDFAPGIAEIDDFACYGMPDLVSVTLSETLTEVGDAVFRACDALQSVHYAAPQGNFYALRALLSEPEPAFRCELKLRDGEAELYFPSFLNEFDEDTMARAIHPRIEGCGYAFRECVTRREIDFFQYDRQFARAAAAEREAACRIAIGRLRYPYRLAEVRRKAYRDCLAAESETAAELAFRDYEVSRDRARLVAIMTWLRREQLLSGEARRFALEEAGKVKLVELSAELLQGREQKKSTDFSL
ncbi:leucine-rich repeat protein [Stomatobaculum longum]|uniref:leucine-rich repeat protein n=1 Tax=Stomatobaculum longum TaxID=796942 RepID=UPI0028E4BF5C|nr:leucine-rich repeat protein [Stomatobaculum longum]